MLRRYHEASSHESAAWEERLVAGLARRGWPVAAAVDALVDGAGRRWALLPLLPGRKRPSNASRVAAERGRLLAELHVDLAAVEADQRPGWITAARAVADLERTTDAVVDAVRAAGMGDDDAKRTADVVTNVAAVVERLYPRLGAHRPIHGDFVPWNLLFTGPRVSGILDFEKARVDAPAVDVAFATWGGRYEHDVLRGYESVRPLAPAERALVEPLWRAICLSSLRPAAGASAATARWAVAHALRPWGA